jgi:hypothetical protein
VWEISFGKNWGKSLGKRLCSASQYQCGERFDWKSPDVGPTQGRTAVSVIQQSDSTWFTRTTKIALRSRIGRRQGFRTDNERFSVGTHIAWHIGLLRWTANIRSRAAAAKMRRDRTDVLISVVLLDSMSRSCLTSGKSVVSEWCTLIDTEVGLEVDLSATPPCANRNEDNLNAFSALSVVDRSRTWSRLFNLKVAEVSS